MFDSPKEFIDRIRLGEDSALAAQAAQMDGIDLPQVARQDGGKT
jgi:hypothetical protein